MKRFLAITMLSFALLAVGSGSAQAQLKKNILDPGTDSKFSAKSIFSNVYETGADGLEKNLPAAVGSIISAFLGFVGVIMLVIMVYAGYLWLTAGGNDDQVAHAKQLIKNGVIGMAITLSAFVITQFVVNQLTGALTQTQTPGAPPPRTTTPAAPAAGTPTGGGTTDATR